MHNSLKIIKTLLYSYSALHVSGTLAPIVRRLLILHMQPPVTVCRWVGLCSRNSYRVLYSILCSVLVCVAEIATVFCIAYCAVYWSL
jgi:hypothetical protein